MLRAVLADTPRSIRKPCRQHRLFLHVEEQNCVMVFRGNSIVHITTPPVLPDLQAASSGICSLFCRICNPAGLGLRICNANTCLRDCKSLHPMRAYCKSARTEAQKAGRGFLPCEGRGVKRGWGSGNDTVCTGTDSSRLTTKKPLFLLKERLCHLSYATFYSFIFLSTQAVRVGR